MASSENVKGIRIEIGGDTTPLYNALNDASKKTKELESDLKDLNKALKTDPRNVELLTKKFNALGDIVDSCKNEVSILKRGLTDAQLKFKNGEITEDQFNQVARSTEQAQKKLEFYQKQFDDFKDKEKRLLEIKDAMDDVEKEEKEVTEAFQRYYDELQNTSFQDQPEKWQEIHASMEESRAKMDEVKDRASDLTDQYQELTREMNDASSGMEIFGQSSETAGAGLGEAGHEQQSFEQGLKDLENSLSSSAVAFALINEAVKLVSKVMQEAIKKMGEWLQNLDKIDVATRKLGKDMEEYLKSLEKSERQQKLDVGILDARFKSINRLNDQIIEGNNLGKDTAKLQQQLKREVDALNSSVGAEVLTISRQNGALAQSRTELEKVRQSVLAYAEAQYELDAIMELVARKHELEEQIADRTYQNYAGGLGKLQEELDNTNQKLQQHTDAYIHANDSLIQFNDTTELLMGTQEESAHVIEETSKIGIESAIEVYNKEKEYQQKRLDLIIDTNHKIEEESDTSLKERVKIMQNNADAILHYEENVAFLRKLMQETTDKDLKIELQNYLDYLDGDFSEENMQIVKQLVEDMGEGGGETAREFLAFFKGENIPSDMYGVGKDIVNELNKGIKDNESKILNTASTLASKIANKLKIKVNISASSSAIDFSPYTKGAQGGIVTKPTAMLVGEMGAEAILPLDKLAGIISETMASGGNRTSSAVMNVYPQSMSASQQEMLFKKFDRMMGQSTSTQEVG